MSFIQHIPNNSKIAISTLTEHITFSQLHEKIQSTIQYYENISERSVVWIDCKNTIQTLILFISFWEKNCCVVPIDPQMTLSEIQTLHKIIAPNLIVNQTEGGNLSQISTTDLTNSDILDANTVQLSSGSTGEPKIILISNKAIIYRAISNFRHLALNETDKTLCSVPLSHSHGIDCLALPSLFSGGTLYITDPQTSFPNRILDWIEKYGITFFSSIPQMYNYFNQIYSQSYQQKKWNLSTLRYPFCGSAALSLETAKQFNKNFNLKLNQGYGLAEIGVICVNLKADSDKYDSIGEPIPGIDWKLSADSELWVRSKALFSGYYRKKEETEQRMTVDGYLMTEDLINVSQEFLYIVGRKNDFINVMGKKVYPKEIEDQLASMGGLADYCVTSEPDPERGQVPVLHLVQSHLDTEMTEKKIFEYLTNHMEQFKIPKKIKWHASFPKSPLGKVIKSKL